MLRLLIAIPLLIVFSNFSRADELSETLVWMDNSYNPHQDVSGAYGHGHTGWYAPNGPNDEFLVSGSTETFTYNGCQMTLRIQDDPTARALSEMQTTVTYTFNLRDINPQSIKVSTYTHIGGWRCDMTPGADCDHAAIDFVTHSEAPLIDEGWDTIFPKLQGSDHETKHTSKGKESSFDVDDIEYASRLAKAFRHAVELCGGKPEPF
jgi:hypothetical protein